MARGFLCAGQQGFHRHWPRSCWLAGDDQWPLKRPPLRLETSVPGIFAVSDTPAGSVKRIDSGVGEGPTAVHLVHRYLAECADQSAPAQPEQMVPASVTV
jgi:thioredoxin reductase (NADPH)